MGRLYDLIQDGTGTNYLEEGWARLDWVIDECAKRHMWVVLDLHGTPGAQNGADHSGQPKGLGNRLWNSVEYRKRLAHLWNTVAARYATNTTVAGYDLFNEPDPEGAGTKTAIYSNSILPVLEMVYRAIRSNDSQHIVFMMSNFMYTNMWNDIWACPAPAARGWSNVVYEFHHYDRIRVWQNDVYDPQFDSQKSIADEIVRTYTRFSQARNVPVFIGEFMPVDMQNFDYFIRRFEASNLHWAHWNFRHWGWDDTNRPWSSWGLDYLVGGVYGGVNTNIQPNVMTDDFATLMDKLTGYNFANYAPNTHLQHVVKNNTGRRRPDYTEFYLNTFSSPNGDNINQRWPWQKIAGIGHPNAFQIEGNRARIDPSSGAVLMRWKSRVEADARFKINDSGGSWFEVQLNGVKITNQVGNPEAEIRLAIVRDEITSVIKQYDTPGLIARMEYDAGIGTTNVNLYVYRKTGGTNTWGTLLYSESGVPFSTNALRLHVSVNSLSLIYNGITRFTTNNHGLDVSVWPDGAVCAVEVEDVSGNTEFVYLDNMKGWREDVTPVPFYEGTFTNAPDGMMVRSLMGDAAVYLNWSHARDTASYVTNGRVMFLPGDNPGDKTWLNARKDFQNDLRLDVSTGGVAEVRVALREFVNGYTKIGLMPEYYPGFLYDDWNSVALYLEMSRSGGNITFTAYRTHGVEEARTALAGPASCMYDDVSDVTVQVSSNWFVAYYGTNVVVDAAHGVTNYLAVYPNGLHPHVEYQSGGSQSFIVLDALKCRLRDGFGPPSEE